jgi:hypothetical protein
VGKIYTAVSDPLDAMLARHLMSSSLGGGAGAGAGGGGGQACEGARGRGQAHGLAGGGGEEGEGGGGWVEEGLVELVPQSVHEILLRQGKLESLGAHGGEEGSGGERLRGYGAVWLGYDNGRPFAARELRQCSEWQDLRDVLESGLLDVSGEGEGGGRGEGEEGEGGGADEEVGEVSGAVLGISVNYAPNGEVWEESAVDWLVRGVQVAAARARLRATALRVLRYVLQSPRMAVILLIQPGLVLCMSPASRPRAPGCAGWGGLQLLQQRTQERMQQRVRLAEGGEGGEGGEGAEGGGERRPAVSGWRESVGWDGERVKKPSPCAVKYLRVRYLKPCRDEASIPCDTGTRVCLYLYLYQYLYLAIPAQDSALL